MRRSTSALIFRASRSPKSIGSSSPARSGGNDAGRPSIFSWTTRSGSERSFEPEVAERDLRDALRHRAGDERSGRRGEQHLAAVTGRADPRGAVDVDPDVPLLAHDRLAGVHAHPHAELLAVRPAVRRERALSRRRPRRPRRARARRRRRTRRPACRSPARRASRTRRGGCADARRAPRRSDRRAARGAWSSPRCR